MHRPLLIVFIGPTGVGKTEVTLHFGEALKAEIFSADSRQMYCGIEIGTAAPTHEQLERVTHHFVGFLDLQQYYSAAEFESQCLTELQKYYEDNSVAILTGGSMLYIDSLCKGIDDIPTVDSDTRLTLIEEYEQKGLEWLQGELRRLDPTYYSVVDRCNHKRLLHAVEVCRMTGRPFSAFHTGRVKERPFRIVRIGLQRDRTELYERINQRVDEMVEQGLVEQARSLLPLAHLNSLNTVGYKELFCHFRNECSLNEAIEKIKQHSRIYARKQITWFKRDESIRWFHPSELEAMNEYILSQK